METISLLLSKLVAVGTTRIARRTTSSKTTASFGSVIVRGRPLHESGLPPRSPQGTAIARFRTCARRQPCSVKASPTFQENSASRKPKLSGMRSSQSNPHRIIPIQNASSNFDVHREITSSLPNSDGFHVGRMGTQC